MSDPNNVVVETAKAVAEMPFWMVVVLAMSSALTGEMMRASTLTGLSWKQILARILMRFGAAGLVGIAVFMLAYAYSTHPYVAAALCIFSAMIGGDLASSLFERWAAKRLGVCDLPTSPGDSAQQPPK